MNEASPESNRFGAAYPLGLPSSAYPFGSKGGGRKSPLLLSYLLPSQHGTTRQSYLSYSLSIDPNLALR